MSAALLWLLLAAAAWLMLAGAPAFRAGDTRGKPLPLWSRLLRARASGRGEAEAETLPRLVRQLASLLAAGRTGPELWSLLSHVLMVESQDGHSVVGQRRHGMAAPDNGHNPVGEDAVGDDATLALLLRVERAASLGLSGASAIRAACASEQGTAGRVSGVLRRGSSSALSAGQRRMWLETAACLDVCEASGAPVASVLNRLAAAMEAEFDAAAQRATALAGPRATVRLLSWLPFIGLGLGMAMGVDPLSVLFGSQVGWMVLGAGIIFTAAGRMWSSALISQAAGSASGPAAASARGRPSAKRAAAAAAKPGR